MKISVCLDGTKSEIESTLATLKAIGLSWKSDSEYYGADIRRCGANNLDSKFTYYLNDVKPAQPLPTPNKPEPQPRPGDMVLGGKKRQLDDA